MQTNEQDQSTTMTLPKSEILFFYDSIYSVPNGDPFTGEQRYDEETRRSLVSDVRIKRFIRDWLQLNSNKIFVSNKGATEGKGVTAADRIKELILEHPDQKDILELLKNCIDFRLFGGISTAKDTDEPFKGKKFKNLNVNVTGPIQFALLNPSLNTVELRMHQNTSVFSSKTENERGTIGTSSVVPYALNQIHGWINPYSARQSGLTDEDVSTMFRAMWESINNANTRSKSNQNSLLLLQVVYSHPNKKVYGLDKLIRINPNPDIKEMAYRSSEDYTLDFNGLKDKLGKNPSVEKVLFYTEIDGFKTAINNLNDAKRKVFEFMPLYPEEK